MTSASSAAEQAAKTGFDFSTASTHSGHGRFNACDLLVLLSTLPCHSDLRAACCWRPPNHRRSRLVARALHLDEGSRSTLTISAFTVAMLAE